MTSKGKRTKKPVEADNGRQQLRAQSNNNLKLGLFKKIMEHLQASQHNAKSHPKIIDELKNLYFRQTDPAEAKEYQKYFFNLIWTAMLVPFREAKCAAQERMIKVFTTFALCTGTPSDVEECGFPIPDLPPFYTYIVRIFRNNHGDVRPLVRLRLIELIYEILKEKHEDSFFENEKVKINLRKNLLERSKDKHPLVRSVAFRCFALIEIDPEHEILKRLKFHAEFDPHAEARKSALTALVTLTNSRASFLVRKAFDLNEDIRIEAFKALVHVPFSKLKTEQRYKIIQWGLMQPVGVIKKIVTKDLLPAWIADESCGNNVINLLYQLDIARNSSTAELLFRALIPDDSEETFEKMDLSFLNDNKLVPIEDISVEKMIYWRYICGKFKNRPYCLQKIIPESGNIIIYIEKLIEGIHKECTRVAAENLEEEDMEHILCLSHILRIAERCQYEECSRRMMETLLGKILRDPMLDEAVIIYTAVDVAHKIVEKCHFNNFMIEILQGIFEICELEFDTESERDGRPGPEIAFEGRVQTPQSNRSKSSSISPATDAVPALQISNNPSAEREDNCSVADIGSQVSLSDGSVDSEKENVPTSPVLAPLPLPVGKLRADEIKKLKNERATLVVQRHRLMMKKEAAVKLNDFPGAQSIHNEMEAIKDQENMITNQIEQWERSEIVQIQDMKSPEVGRNDSRSQFLSPIMHPSLLEVRRSLLRLPDTVPERPSISEPRLSFAVAAVEKDHSHEIDELQGAANKTYVSLANSLRGVVILTRYLTWQNELNLYVRTMYDSHILTCMEDKDYRLRMYALYLICIVGMIEKSQAQKSMAVMIQGLTSEEHESVEVASFKGMVDLLLQYDYTTFRATEDDDDYARELPYPLNDPSISAKQMEVFFVKKLLSFAFEEEEKEQPRMSHFSTKVLGFLKLFLRDRISDEDVIGWLLSLWAELKYTGTSVCFNIGYWVPVYTSMGASQALRMGKAFVKSVKNLLNKDTGSNDEDSRYDIMKLAHLVISSTSSRMVQISEKMPTVHEEVALLILMDINQNLDHPHSLVLAKFLKMLDIETKPAVYQIRQKLDDMLQTIAGITDMVAPKLKVSLKALEVQLAKRFGPLGETQEDMDIGVNGTSESDSESIGKLDTAIGQLELDPTTGPLPPQGSMVFHNGSEIMNTSDGCGSLSLPGSRVSRSSTMRNVAKSINTTTTTNTKRNSESESESDVSRE